MVTSATWPVGLFRTELPFTSIKIKPFPVIVVPVENHMVQTVHITCTKTNLTMQHPMLLFSHKVLAGGPGWKHDSRAALELVPGMA